MNSANSGKSRVTAPDFRADPTRPETWIQREGEILRQLPGRRVFRAGAGGLPVVVKEYRPGRLLDRFRSRATEEADRALEAAGRGIPVVEPVAHARLDDGREWLFLREVQDARTLQEILLHDSPTGDARHEIARNAGGLIAKLHAAGFHHRDLHAGNILVRPDNTLLFADAAGLRAGFYLRPKERARSLAGFAPFFLTHASRTDLLVFWGAYGRGSGLAPADLEAIRLQALEQIPGAFRVLSRRRARAERSRGMPFRFGEFQGVVTGDIDPELMKEAVRAADDPRLAEQVLKKSRTAWTFLVGEPGNRFVVKAYRTKKATRPMRDFFLGSRAERAQRAAHAMRHRDFHTPEVVAVLTDGCVPYRSILVTRYAEDHVSLEDCLRDLPARRARELAKNLGRSLRRMHDWGLRHRDLKKDNFLVRRDGTDILFLDLDGVRETRKGELDWGRRARDLANLAGSLLDGAVAPRGLKLRVLDAYLGDRHPPEAKPGQFAWETVRLSEESRQARMRYRETGEGLA